MNIDKFTLLMFMLIVLVIVVVSTSQFQQFQLSSIAVTQNKEIEKSVNATLHDLNDFEDQFLETNQKIVDNITIAHDALLKHVQEIDHITQDRNKILRDLLENQTGNILYKLKLHVNETGENLKLTKINAYNIKLNTDLLRALMEGEGNNTVVTSSIGITRNTTSK